MTWVERPTTTDKEHDMDMDLYKAWAGPDFRLDVKVGDTLPTINSRGGEAAPVTVIKVGRVYAHGTTHGTFNVRVRINSGYVNDGTRVVTPALRAEVETRHDAFAVLKAAGLGDLGGACHIPTAALADAARIIGEAIR